MKALRTTFTATSVALIMALGLSACGNGESSGKQASAEAGEAGHKEGEAGHEETEAGHKEGEAGHEEGEAGHAEGEAEGGERVTIPAASAEASQIGVATAGPGALQETLGLTGRMMLQPTARAEVHAPYPGPVRAVLRNIGDSVRRGETLARVESSESLQTYAVVTPIAGVVLERQTNIGDVTADQPLFVVGDLSRLQVELNVATRDMGRVSAGQTVIISGLDGASRIEARIASVLPTADAHSQTLIARAPLASGQGASFRPGMAVRGQVVLTREDVTIGVPRDAVQTLEGRSVVFVRVNADTYEARPVTPGRVGGDTIEIVSGLAAGEIYVSENAFLVKAEIGKGSASHEH